ncbi:hypothetical protein GWK47_053821 [Chionoecetes opilio]|uniref:Uncharacterized protein n=1 Tax=Chionoecetes opilio TaxID=41210 RepID=A0A8J4XYV4_CHIOP|nr:hypothetical protein GWK47_053821 [Chionoecetes opilio]
MLREVCPRRPTENPNPFALDGEKSCGTGQPIPPEARWNCARDSEPEGERTFFGTGSLTEGPLPSEPPSRLSTPGKGWRRKGPLAIGPASRPWYLHAPVSPHWRDGPPKGRSFIKTSDDVSKEDQPRSFPSPPDGVFPLFPLLGLPPGWGRENPPLTGK